MTAPAEGSTAVYRLYGVTGQLLYVGVTNDLRRRWNQHSLSQPWWHLVTRRDFEWHPDRAAAEDAEALAITAEGPLYNIRDVPGAGFRHGQYDDTEDRRRIKRLLRKDAKQQYFHRGRTFYLAALAERYGVSPTTLWSVIWIADGRCFTSSRGQVTVLCEPKF